jgi:hypothetical protein
MKEDELPNANGAVRFEVPILADSNVSFNNGSLIVDNNKLATITYHLTSVDTKVRYAVLRADAGVPEFIAYKVLDTTTNEVQLDDIEDNVWLIGSKINDARWSVPYPIPRGIFVGMGSIVDDSEDSYDPTVIYSKDIGMKWEYASDDLPSSPTYAAFGGGKFVLSEVDKFIPTIWTSNDGAIWSDHTLSGVPTTNFSSGKIAYGDEKFVMLNSSDDGNIPPLYSADTINWNSATDSEGDTFTGKWVNVAYGDGMFLAIGADLTSMYSTNGTDWTKVDNPNPATVSNDCYLVYGDKKFVLLNDDGTVFVFNTSSKTWTNTPNILDSGSKGLAHGGGRFVAIYSNNIFWSDDAVWWIQGTITHDDDLSAISYGNGKFLVGTSTEILESFNGETWTNTTRFTDDEFDSLTLIYGRP